MAKRHRNIFREYLEAHARDRAASGLAPFTHAEWAAHFNERRPKIGGKRVSEVAESSISRAVSGSAGVARRIGMDRRWILKLCGIDYDEYLSAWGEGPAAAQRGREENDRTDGGRPAVE